MLLAGLAWFALAVLCMHISLNGHAVLLVWLPNGVAVGLLLLTPRREWALPVAMLGGLSVLGGLLVGTSLVQAFAFAFANLADAMIVASLAKRMEMGKQLYNLRSADMFRFTGIAAAGALASALIGASFRNGETTWYSYCWWTMTVMLGTLVITPLALTFLNAEAGRSSARIGLERRRTRELTLAGFGMLCLSFLVLNVVQFPLLFLPMALTVYGVMRYGQLGGSVLVMAFSLAGTINSLGGKSPAAFLDLHPQYAGLLIQVYMVALLLTTFPLATLLVNQGRLALRLKMRNKKMRENLTMLEMAESLAGVGRWRLDPKTFEQDWSDELYRINGIEPGVKFGRTNALSLLPDKGVSLMSQLEANKDNREPYFVEYCIHRPDGEQRSLKMRVANEFDEQGMLAQRFGVVLDVTEQRKREEELDLAKENALQLAAEAQKLANTDPLTGLANRRSTMAQLQKCIRRTQASGRPLAVVAFDLDHFKRINDNFGHQTGDEVLVQIADLARLVSRDGDLVGRTGGEEFVWLLPGATAEMAEQAAERLREAVEQRSGDGGLPTITASIGYAVWRSGDTCSVLLNRADEALYGAKNAGRNRVKMAA